MAKFSRVKVVNTILDCGMVPLLYNPDVEVCKKIVTACYNAGIHVFEFTNRGDFAQEVFSELVKYVDKQLPEMILGVGSVVDSSTAAMYMQMSANFIVSPLLNEDMAKVCNRRKVLWMPGCGSLSEISKAEELGAEIVKLFPAKQLGGPSFIKSIKPPCPWTSIMPSGGVEAEEANLREWFSAGAVCVGMGSNLFPSSLIKNQQFDELEKKLKTTFQMVQKIKKEYIN
jgi:2-dehydro-3-deoxyphosphogluconate aldolase/(4S)-4-hydroxy-2-oxoglutarate aldolase